MLTAPNQPRAILRVRNPAEARLVASAGIERVLVALDDATAVRAVFAGTLRAEPAPKELLDALGSVVDEIVVAADDLHAHVEPLQAWRTGAPARSLIVHLRLDDDLPAAIERFAGLADSLLLEIREGDRIGTAACRLDRFASACRAAHIRFGFSGSLEAPDYARLLLWRPDEFEIDSVVRADGASGSAVDMKALDRTVALLRGSGMPPDGEQVVDRLFVRDLVVTQAVGAYRAEHNAPQRVRFGVEADVARSRRPPHDMSDVFSYDLIIDTVRSVADRGHVLFVEQLADEIAAALLAHPAVQRIRVTVEKLDIIDGSVGITIERPAFAG